MTASALDKETRAAFLQSVDRFVRDRLAPNAQKIDDEAVFPRELYKAFADTGALGLWVPQSLGGFGPDLVAPLKIVERLARENVAFAVTVSNCGDCLAPIAEAGAESVKQRWLPGIMSGDLVPAFCLSEPGGGSDVVAMTTTARREGDSYVIDGRKMWITSAPAADVFVVFAKTDVAAAHKGITAFVVPRDTPGLTVGAPERLLGLHSSPTAEVSFDNVRVPVEARLGEEGAGFKLAMVTLDESRLSIACVALGAAATAVETASQYARERVQFGKTLIEHQGLGFIISDLATGLANARAILADAVRMLERSRDRRAGVYAAMAKLVCTDFAMSAAVTAAQVMGGYGLTRASPVARLIRDCKALQIFEGANEIQKWIISREIQKNGLQLADLDELLP